MEQRRVLTGPGCAFVCSSSASCRSALRSARRPRRRSSARWTRASRPRPRPRPRATSRSRRRSRRSASFRWCVPGPARPAERLCRAVAPALTPHAAAARQAERRIEEAAEHEAQLALAQASAPPAVEESAIRRASDVARAEAAAAAAAAQRALRAQVEALERDAVRQRGELADARALAAERGARTAALEDKYAAAVQVSRPHLARACAARPAPAVPASLRGALRPTRCGRRRSPTCRGRSTRTSSRCGPASAPSLAVEPPGIFPSASAPPTREDAACPISMKVGGGGCGVAGLRGCGVAKGAWCARASAHEPAAQVEGHLRAEFVARAAAAAGEKRAPLRDLSNSALSRKTTARCGGSGLPQEYSGVGEWSVRETPLAGRGRRVRGFARGTGSALSPSRPHSHGLRLALVLIASELLALGRPNYPPRIHQPSDAGARPRRFEP